MAEVVITSQAPISSATGIIGQIFAFFHDNLIWIIVMLVIVILAVIIWMLFMNNEEALKERDDPAYALYKNHIRTCKLRSDSKRVKTTYSLLNLLWFGIPLKWNEHSCKIVNYDNGMIGYYRGHFESMDNCLNILAYKHKSFIFFEDTFIIKIPMMIKYNEGKSKSNDVKLKNNPQVKEDLKYLNLRNMIKFWPNGDIKLYCTDVEKVGNYYYAPVFIMDSEFGKLDYRKFMEGGIIDQTYQSMLQRIVTEGMKSMEKMPSFNPYIQVAQKSPVKTQEEEKIEGTE